MPKTFIQKHDDKLPDGGDAFLIGNTSNQDMGFKVPDMFDLSKPQKHPKYGKIWFRRLSGSFFYAAYSGKKKFATRTKTGPYDYLLYDGGHSLVTV